MKHTPKKLFLRVNGVYETIEIDTISYAQAEGDYIKLFFGTEKPYLIRLSLSKLENFLPADKFLRVHRSFLINVDQISQFDPKKGTLSLRGHKAVFPSNRGCRDRLYKLIARIN